MMEALQKTDIWDEVYDFLATFPNPEQILEFRPSETAQERLRYLLDQNRNKLLSAEENLELEELSRVNHFMRMLKIRVRERIL